MFELGIFNKNNDELVMCYELNISLDDVLQIVGFSLLGNCADLSEGQVRDLEVISGVEFKVDFAQHSVEICEVEYTPDH